MRGRHDQSAHTPGGANPPGVSVSGPPHPGIAYRPEIDGLRAIAVLAVVLYHVDASLLPGGFVGVDVFFVISGYLIGGQLLAELNRSGTIDYLAFLARRVRRLMPAFMLVFGVALPVSALILAPFPSEVESLRVSGMMSAIYLANAYFQSATGGYFDTPVERLPLLHLWSLAVEEQFYLVFPLLLLIAARRTKRPIVVWLLVLSVLSLLVAEHLMSVHPRAAFYSMPSRFWELAAGAIIASLPPSKIPLPLTRHTDFLASSGLAAIAVAAMVTDPASFPGIGAILPVAGAAFVIMAVHAGCGAGISGRLLASGPMVWIGLLSYPLYLWHWPLLAWDRILTLEPSSTRARFGLALLAVLLAWLTFRFVEVPVRRTHAKARRMLVLGALGVALMLVLSSRVHQIARVGGVQASEVAAIALDRPSDTNGCHHRLQATRPQVDPISCTLLNGRGRAVVMWGDSHALAWRPFAVALAASRGAPLQAFSMDSCLPLDRGAPNRADFPSHGKACDKFNAQVLDHIISSRPALVILAARWPPRLGAGALLSRGEERERAERGWVGRYGEPGEVSRRLRRTLEAVAASGAEIIVIGPAPVSQYDVARCVAVSSPASCALDRAVYRAQAAEAWRVLVEAVRGLPGTSLIDPADYFCGPDTCEAIREGKPMYWDDDHVSSSAAAAFAQAYLDDPARYTLPAERTGLPGR